MRASCARVVISTHCGVHGAGASACSITSVPVRTRRVPMAQVRAIASHLPNLPNFPGVRNGGWYGVAEVAIGSLTGSLGDRFAVGRVRWVQRQADGEGCARPDRRCDLDLPLVGSDE